jgi:multicomponent Na+:H+ antiporter subunit B
VTRSARRPVILAGLAAFAALLIWGLTGLPAAGHVVARYPGLVARGATQLRHVTDAVSAVNFDFRAFDTLGEELILFTAVLGVATILRAGRGEEEALPHEHTHDARHLPPASDALRVAGVVLIGLVLLVGLYIVTHGHLTPGGGFQGGVILAAGFLVVFLGGELVTARRLRPVRAMELVHALGAGGFACLGLAAVIGGAAFFKDFLPLGVQSHLLSGGTIPLGNVAVGTEVAGAFVLLFSELLAQALIARGRP